VGKRKGILTGALSLLQSSRIAAAKGEDMSEPIVYYQQCTLIAKIPVKRRVKKGRGRKTREKVVFMWKPIKVMRPKPPPKEWGEYPDMSISVRPQMRVKVVSGTTE